MNIRKLDSGRWQARLKQGRVDITTKSFATRREAVDWLTRERAAMVGGFDIRAGRVTVRNALPHWLEERKTVVSPKTYVADSALQRLVPPPLAALQLGSVTEREVARALVALRRKGLKEGSVKRFRASLSAFFAWAVRERMIQQNPVTPTRVPKASEVVVEMLPFSEKELEAFVRAASQLASRDSAGPVRAADRARDLDRLSKILLVAGWTGLRWSELREIRVGDVVEAPMPALYVRRAAPEGGQAKRPKSGKSRLVPLADRVLPIVRELMVGRTQKDLLFVTATGHRLHASAVKRAVDWDLIAAGRRIHDLRHTAACLWLAKGVDATTVQAWMGHASIATTNIYLHHLGTTADRAGLDRLNRRRGIGGDERKSQQG